VDSRAIPIHSQPRFKIGHRRKPFPASFADQDPPLVLEPRMPFEMAAWRLGHAHAEC
jgi:hypothetical protein